MAAHKLPILIIGGGLAGLSLAQALKRSSIPFHVYERDASLAARAQGYRIRINSEGSSALEALLSPSMLAEFEGTCGSLVLGGNSLDALTALSAPAQGPPGRQLPPEIGKHYNADRAVLRKVLLQNMDDDVSFGKKFVRYEIGVDGVNAYFSYGTTVKGRMIVGADGTHSPVRKQLVLEMSILDSEGRAIFGKTILTPEISALIPNEIRKGNCLIANRQDPAGPLKLFMDVMKFNCEFATEVPLPADYIYWVLVFQQAREGLPIVRALLSLSRSQSADLSTKMIKTWHPSIRAIVEHQDSASTSTLAFTIATPSIEPWNTSECVTILGDAAHPIPPVGGVGANVAFQDAADLFVAIKDGGNLTQIATFETSMRKRVKTVLERTAGAAGMFFGMKAIGELKPAKIWE